MSKHVVALAALAAAAGCGARSDLPVALSTESAPDRPTETFESPCTASLTSGAPAAILGYCPTRTHRSRSPAPWAPTSSAALPILANAERVAIDGAGRVYVVVHTMTSAGVGSPRALAALEPDGSVAWQTEIDGTLVGMPLLAASGSIFLFSTLFGDDLALIEFTSSGDVTRVIPLPPNARPNPGIGEDGALYIAVDDSKDEPDVKVVAIEPDGTPRWTFSTPGWSIGEVAVGPGDRVVVEVGEEVVWLRPDGTEEIRRYFDRRLASGPAIADDGAVYVTTQAIDVVDDADGLHVFEADGTPRFVTPLGRAPRLNQPIPLAHDGTAFVPTHEALVAVGPDGAIRWKKPLDQDLGTAPYGCAIDVHGTVLVSWTDLIALDPNDGRELWRLAPASLDDDGGPGCIDAVTIGLDRLYFRECGGELRVASD